MTSERKKNLYLLLASIIFSVILAEVVLRIAVKAERVFFRFDPLTAVWHREGVEGWFLSEGPGVWVRINSQGLRDVEHSKQKPADTYRIAILGDSYAAAMEVEQHETFWSILQDKLREEYKNKAKIEVINFGVAGFGTAQEFLTLKHRVSEYSPNLVLLAFLSGNDIRDNSKALNANSVRPYFVWSGTNLVLDNGFRNSGGIRSSRLLPVVSFLIDHSRVVYLARKVQRGWRNRTTAKFEAGLDYDIYLAPRSKAWEEAWDITTTLIGMCRDEARALNADFLLVSLSNGFQVEPDDTARTQFSRDNPGADPFYPEKILREYCATNNIPIVTCAEHLQQEAKRLNISPHGFGGNYGHYNPEGHRMVGEYLARQMIEKQVLFR